MKILNRYEEGNWIITEYTKDGVSISHRVATLVPQPSNSKVEDITITIEEQILYENQYQTLLLEMGGM